MARLAVVNAIEGHAAENWSHTPIDGMVLKQPRVDESASFLAIQYPVPPQSFRLSTGTRRYRDEGAFRAVLLFTRDQDRAVMLQRADEFASLYRDQTINSVRCLQPTSPFINDSNDEGNFYSLSVVVPYTYEYEG